METKNLLPWIIAAFIFLLFGVFTSIVKAQVDWTEHQSNPVINYGESGSWDELAAVAPKVIQDGDTLKMWYASGGCGPAGNSIGYAWSLDGFSWNRYENNPVFTPQQGNWDEGGVVLGAVMKDGDTLRMWYEGIAVPNITTAGIGYATSVDGINWMRHQKPVLESADIGDWVSEVIFPDFVIKEENIFKMWFTGGIQHPPGLTQGSIGLATSSDGINWDVYDNPLTTNPPFDKSDPVLQHSTSGTFDNISAGYSSVMKKEEGTYEMWYAGNESSIGYATSPDGIAWTKYPGNPVLAAPTSGWGIAYFFPCVLMNTNEYRMWFSGIDPGIPFNGCVRIGYATAPVAEIKYNLEVFANNIFTAGFEFDSQGKLWAAEGRPGTNNDRVSIITTGGDVYPFITGLPSTLTNNRPDGVIDVNFDSDGKLLIVRAGGTDSLGSSILVVDTTGFVPGSPKNINDIEKVYKIREFALSQGSVTPFLRWVINGPDDDLFITERGLKGIIRRESSTGNLSVFRKWEDFHAQGIVFTGDKFFVSSMTDPPQSIGEDKIYEVDLSGNYTEYQTNLTAVMSLTTDPQDNKIVFIQLGLPSNGDWLPNTGGVFKINNGVVDTIVYPINYPFALRYNSNNELFVSSLSGVIYKITSTLTDVETIEGEAIPSAFHLSQNYPNPFNPSTSIEYRVLSTEYIKLKVFDVLGREVVTLVNEEKPAGTYEVSFDASGLSSGVYFYKIEAGEFVETKKMILLR